jgi:hypothetical protein
MFKISTVNLSADTATAAADYGEQPLGELSAEELTALLERLRDIHPEQNAEADPHVLIAAPAGHFLVRTGQGKLLLYNARDHSAPYSELTAAQIVAQLHAIPAAPAATGETAASSPAPSPHRGIAVAILVAGLALNGYTLYSAFYSESVSVKTAVTLLTDPAEIVAHGHDVVGTFATGGQNGDRVIVVSADGRVAFSEIGNPRSASNTSDTYRLGRHAKRLCLSTADSGLIEVMNIDTVVYYRDVYKRTR